jgi:hypothetical protein
MFDLANEEVDFEARLCLAGLKVWHYNVGEYFTEVLTLSTSVATRQNSCKHVFAFAAPSVASLFFAFPYRFPDEVPKVGVSVRELWQKSR